MEGIISVILIDDHSLVRDGIKSLLVNQPHIQVIEEASSGPEGLEKIAQHKPDVAITDIRMPGMDGIETVREMAKYREHTKALILSMHEADDYVLNAVEAGAYGYILKDASKEEFLTAVQTVAEGKKYFSGAISKVIVDSYLQTLGGPAVTEAPTTPTNTYTEVPIPTPAVLDIKLTRRELQVLQLVIEGLKSREIADKLDKSVRTIEAHRFSLMKKMEVHNVMDLTLKAKEMGLI